MVVTKNQSAKDVNDLLSMGFKLFGENRVQEAKAKYQFLESSNKNIKLHLIGPLQRNKSKDCSKGF